MLAAAAGSAATARLHSAEGMRLIDYEYSGFNPIAFDVANHWCEWAADYHTDAPHELDFALLPAATQQRAFVEQYLRALLEVAGVTLTAEGEVPATAGTAAATEAVAAGARAGYADSGCRHSVSAWLQAYAVPCSSSSSTPCVGAAGWARLVADVHAASLAFMCASHAHWALWGWIQAQVSDVDFDFHAYAQQRWEQYLLTRPKALQQQ